MELLFSLICSRALKTFSVAILFASFRTPDLSRFLKLSAVEVVNRMMLTNGFFYIWICCVVFGVVRAQYVPDSQALTIKELEHLYLDAAPSGFLSVITPCSNYVDATTGQPSNSLGRQQAAEWIRTAFRKALSS